MDIEKMTVPELREKLRNARNELKLEKRKTEKLRFEVSHYMGIMVSIKNTAYRALGSAEPRSVG